MAKRNIITTTNEIINSSFSKYFTLKERGSESAKLNGMKMLITGFDIISKKTGEKIAVCSVMSGKMLSVMNMYTFICCATKVDAPLYSFDRILAMGNDTAINESYDTGVSMNRSEAENALTINIPANLPEYPLLNKWYDSIKLTSSFSFKGKTKVYGDTFDKLCKESMDAFVELLNNAPACDEKAKYQKNKYYVEGLLKNGGSSTDIFKKSVGEARTEELYYDLIFGIGR